MTEWTRNDLPKVESIIDIDPSEVGRLYLSHALEAVLDHLQAHHPKPDTSRIRNLEWEVAETSNGARRAVNERAAMRRARDAAVARAETAERAAVLADGERRAMQERAEQAEQAERAVDKWRTATESAHSDFLQAAHERDEWKARAEAAEQYAEAVSDSNRDNAARAEKAEAERDGWRENANHLSTIIEQLRARARQAEKQLCPSSPLNQQAGAQAQAAAYGMDKDTGPNPYPAGDGR